MGRFLLFVRGGFMTDIAFRAAQLADLPAIIAMLADDQLGSQRVVVSDPLDEGYLAAFRAIEVDPNQHLVVATAGDAVIGTLQLSFLPGLSRRGAWRGQIEAVRIVAPFRNTGLGQRMMEWAIAECRARGCKLVQLTTDKSRADAHRFYDRLGFVASHLGYKLSL